MYRGALAGSCNRCNFASLTSTNLTYSGFFATGEAPDSVGNPDGMFRMFSLLSREKGRDGAVAILKRGKEVVCSYVIPQ